MSEATNISTCHVSIFAKNSSECHNLPLYFITFSFSINLILGFPANCYICGWSWKRWSEDSLSKSSFSTLHLLRSHSSFILGLVVLLGRPLFQSFICVERYLGVLHPVTFLKLKPMKYRIIIAVIGCICIICSCSLVTLEVIDIHNRP